MKSKKKYFYILFIFIVALALFSKTTVSASENSTIIVVETPGSSEVVKSRIIQIVGWTVSPKGIKKVEVFVDNNLKDYTEKLYSRKDISQAFPNYTGSENSGFVFTMNTDGMSIGNHQIITRVEGNNGETKDFISNIQIPERPSRIHIESPANELILEDQDINISGWAVNYSGVKEINVIVDGVKSAKINPSYYRNDIYMAFPDYINSNQSGFVYKIDKGSLSLGKHEIKLESIGNDGSATYTTKSINIYKRSALIALDNLADGESIYENTTVSGWAINYNGVNKVNVYVDDVYKTSFKTSGVRNDIYNAFGNYSGSISSGFNYFIDLDTLSVGNHKLKFEVEGNDGTISKIVKSIYTEKRQALIGLDVSFFDKNVIEDLIISGWAVSPKGVKEVKVYLDSSNVANINANFYRPDIYNAFKEYEQSKYSGFQYKLNASKLNSGEHNITFKLISNNGSETEKSVSFKILRKIAIDIGHNVNYDTGANGIRKEDELTKQVGLRLIDKLRANGYYVINTLPTTASSETDSLKQRCDAANNGMADLFVSVHFNAFDGTASGAEVCYVSDKGKVVADKILNNLVADLNVKNRGLQYRPGLYVLANTNMPAILVESLFCDNIYDMKHYDPDKIANAIYNGIVQ